MKICGCTHLKLSYSEFTLTKKALQCNKVREKLHKVFSDDSEVQHAFPQILQDNLCLACVAV